VAGKEKAVKLMQLSHRGGRGRGGDFQGKKKGRKSFSGNYAVTGRILKGKKKRGKKQERRKEWFNTSLFPSNTETGKSKEKKKRANIPLFTNGGVNKGLKKHREKEIPRGEKKKRGQTRQTFCMPRPLYQSWMGGKGGGKQGKKKKEKAALKS